jgi:uncharacterized MAPEG superfamily protein
MSMTMTTAYWCVLAAGLLPYVATVLAKAGPGFNNNTPRDWLEKQTGWRKRAHWAQLNGFEAFPLFAAAVIIAHLAQAPQHRIDVLAGSFVALRATYIALYIADMAGARSVIWAAGMGCVVGLFVISR